LTPIKAEDAKAQSAGTEAVNTTTGEASLQ